MYADRVHRLLRVAACSTWVLLVGACEMGSDDGDRAPYKGVLYVRDGSETKEFLLGRYNDLSKCGKVVDFELQENRGQTVWIRPDWGYLSVSRVEGWRQVTVTGGACAQR